MSSANRSSVATVDGVVFASVVVRGMFGRLVVYPNATRGGREQKKEDADLGVGRTSSFVGVMCVGVRCIRAC